MFDDPLLGNYLFPPLSSCSSKSSVEFPETSLIGDFYYSNGVNLIKLSFFVFSADEFQAHFCLLSYLNSSNEFFRLGI